MRYSVTYLIYIAVLARALGWSQDSGPVPAAVWPLLALFGLLLFTESALTRRLPWYPRLYLLCQSGLVIALLYSAPKLDIFPTLFFPLSFQAVQFLPVRVGFAWIGLFSLAMAGMFRVGLGWEPGIVMLLLATGANLLTGNFAYLIKRTAQTQKENQRLFGELQVAYRQLKDSASQAEALAASDERHRLVRELHDSLTQTLFSMNLAVQAAQISAQNSPASVWEHLVRLQSLARSAAGEVQALTGQTRSSAPDPQGLESAIRRLAEERLAQDGLRAQVTVSGRRKFPEEVESALYRIVQEALNNITRHAGDCQAQIHLWLDGSRASLEVTDNGCGFEPDLPGRQDGYGLAGMAERAGEIGWDLEVESHPGQGTSIRVMEKSA